VIDVEPKVGQVLDGDLLVSTMLLGDMMIRELLVVAEIFCRLGAGC
jgi:hypothetical protein